MFDQEHNFPNRCQYHTIHTPILWTMRETRYSQYISKWHDTHTHTEIRTLLGLVDEPMMYIYIYGRRDYDPWINVFFILLSNAWTLLNSGLWHERSKMMPQDNQNAFDRTITDNMFKISSSIFQVSLQVFFPRWQLPYLSSLTQTLCCGHNARIAYTHTHNKHYKINVT